MGKVAPRLPSAQFCFSPRTGESMGEGFRVVHAVSSVAIRLNCEEASITMPLNTGDRTCCQLRPCLVHARRPQSAPSLRCRERASPVGLADTGPESGGHANRALPRGNSPKGEREGSRCPAAVWA